MLICFGAIPVLVQETSAATCGSFFAPKDFPIEQFYSRPGTLVDDSGRLYIPRGSKAFILWRQNSSPSLPDSAFAFRYLSESEIVRLATADGLPHNKRNSPARSTKGSESEFFIPEEYKATALSLPDWIKLFSKGREEFIGQTWHYVVFRFEKELIFVTVPRPLVHSKFAVTIREFNDQIALVGGGSFELRVNRVEKTVGTNFYPGTAWIADKIWPTFRDERLSKRREGNAVKKILRTALEEQFEGYNLDF